MITNLDRANWADKAIRAFREETLCDFEDCLGDLLCDLMHWADAKNFSFEAALLRAQDHYAEEKAEEAQKYREARALRLASRALYDALANLEAQIDGAYGDIDLTEARAALRKADTT